MFSCCATFCASFGLALPVNTIRLSKAIAYSSPTGNVHRKVWQGRKDSNPRMPESKSGALTNLATPLVLQTRRTLRATDASASPLRHESLHRRGQLLQHALRPARGAVEPREHAASGPGHARRPRAARATPDAPRLRGSVGPTTGSRSLRNRLIPGMRRKVFHFKGFRVSGQFRRAENQRGSGRGPGVPGPRTSAGARRSGRRRSPDPLHPGGCARRGRRARRPPGAAPRPASALGSEARSPTAGRARGASSRHRSSRRPGRRPSGMRFSQLDVGAQRRAARLWSSRAARTARSCVLGDARPRRSRGAITPSSRTRKRSWSHAIDQREDALQQVVAVGAPPDDVQEEIELRRRGVVGAGQAHRLNPRAGDSRPRRASRPCRRAWR